MVPIGRVSTGYAEVMERNLQYTIAKALKFPELCERVERVEMTMCEYMRLLRNSYQNRRDLLRELNSIFGDICSDQLAHSDIDDDGVKQNILILLKYAACYYAIAYELCGDQYNFLREFLEHRDLILSTINYFLLYTPNLTKYYHACCLENDHLMNLIRGVCNMDVNRAELYNKKTTHMRLLTYRSPDVVYVDVSKNVTLEQAQLLNTVYNEIIYSKYSGYDITAPNGPFLVNEACSQGNYLTKAYKFSQLEYEQQPRKGDPHTIEIVGNEEFNVLKLFSENKQTDCFVFDYEMTLIELSARSQHKVIYYDSKNLHHDELPLLEQTPETIVKESRYYDYKQVNDPKVVQFYNRYIKFHIDAIFSKVVIVPSSESGKDNESEDETWLDNVFNPTLIKSEDSEMYDDMMYTHCVTFLSFTRSIDTTTTTQNLSVPAPQPLKTEE